MCWSGADSRGPSSVYVVTDSRLSWQYKTSTDTWDNGRKTFASSSSPDVFGYSGDVVFPALVLSQFVSALDARLHGGTFEERFAALERLVRVSFETFPKAARSAFEIVHCGRDGSGLGCRFRVGLLAWTAQNGFDREVRDVPDRSAAVHLAGSGRPHVQARIEAWQTTDARDTSRVLFRAFADSLARLSDPLSGGAPQLVGVYRIGAGMSFGVLYENKRYLHGMPVHTLAPESGPLWHNELFERVSGVTRKTLPDAQRHGDVVVPPP